MTGHFKSWILLDMLLHLACGKAWLGYSVPQPRKILFLDEEMSQPRLLRRLRRLVEPFTKDEQILLGQNFLPLTNPNFRGRDREVTGLVQSLNTWEWWPDVFVVETLVRTLSGDENESKDVSAFWNAIKPLVNPSSFIISHHLVKPPDPQDKPVWKITDVIPKLQKWTRGSGDISGGSDTIFHTWRESPTSRQVWLACSKHREGEWPPMMVEIVDTGPHDLCFSPHHRCPVIVKKVK